MNSANGTATATVSASRATPPGRPTFFPRPVAWMVFVISLLASAGGWLIAWKLAELEARKRFDEEAGRIAATLSERMRVYEDVLHGAAGLYAASYSVERAEWRAYLQSVSIERRFPGIEGVGFIAFVPREKLAEFIQSTRADNASDFTVKEIDVAADLFITKYVEPEEQQRDLLGRNIGADAGRRAVAERARDTGEAALSGALQLRGKGGALQTGCVMMLPVYRHNLPVSTVEERRAAIEGWVYARFILENLMQGVLGLGDAALHCRVLHARAAGGAQVVFDNDPALSAQRPDERAWFADVVPLRFGGHQWQLKFMTKPPFEAARRRGVSLWVGAAGGLITLLLFSIAWSLSHTRQRALALADEMTGALRRANERLEAEAQERRQAVAALQHSEAIYHSLVESLPLSITRKDREGRLVFVNQRFCTRFGKTREELLGRTEEHLFLPEVAAGRRAADRQVMETGVISETIEERPQPDGSIRYVQAIRVPLFDGSRTVIGVLGIFSDVTDKRRAEAELEHERFLLRTLMDNLPDRIYFKDLQSRFIRDNRAHMKRFGTEDPRAVIGKTDFDFLSAETAQRTFQDEQELIRTGEPITKEEMTTSMDGRMTWALITKMPLRDEQGKIVGTFGISRDITDRKRAEEEMRMAKEAAEEASRAKSHFLASMSHELRTPLNSVIGFANILLKNKAGTLGAAELNFLERILANGKHLLTLINQILDLSKIEARKVELRNGPVALDELVRETIAQQEGLVRDRPVQLVADLPPVVAPLVTDGEKLKQVLINLIGNALKFTEQGSVTVRVETDVVSHQPRAIDVVDTGIGIPPDKLGVIFEAFQQAEAGTARKYGGTGLGLTISQALCRLMGYRIEVTSELGRGSTFRVCLAQAPKPATAASFPVVAPPPSVPGMGEVKGRLVLVIDDELDSRTLLTHMVEEFGCRAITASSGEQGLHMAREFRPDLITVDLMMPQLDGWQVIRAIKADPQLRDIPVVVVSIVAGENRGRILGAVEILQKPVQREELLAVFRRCLPAGRPRILIVEDQPDSQQVLVSHLEDEACEYRVAPDGEAALKLMEEYSPDLVLLDLMMPNMDGMTFLARIRAAPRFQFLPVVVVTAKELTPEEIAVLRRTAQDVVKKGDVFEADLKSILRRLLRDRTPNAPAKP